MHSLVEDLSLLTTIPTNNINKFMDKAIWCICDCLDESKIGKEDITEIDIGIGILSICTENNSIQYRFVPCKKLENAIKSVIVNGKNPLIETAEDKLTKGMLNIHKSFI